MYPISSAWVVFKMADKAPLRQGPVPKGAKCAKHQIEVLNNSPCLLMNSFRLQMPAARCLLTIWTYTSDQRIVIFPANRNRNRFAEPSYVRIGIGIVREFKKLQIGIGIIFVRWEVFANYLQISEIFFLSLFFL